jgi:hypothetical protein
MIAHSEGVTEIQCYRTKRRREYLEIRGINNEENRTLSMKNVINCIPRGIYLQNNPDRK